MTTLAYRDGVLAGDTRTTDEADGILPGHVRKVLRLKNGTLIGFAGGLATMQTIFRDIKKNPNGVLNIQPNEELEGLLIYADGKVMQLDGGGWTERDADFYAIGSGAVPARVAMRCGLDARAAVKIAMEFDSDTGGKVQCVKLREA
jgi:ATP-dependent protease HslVU (ClpYQ) peptidase subunit